MKEVERRLKDKELNDNELNDNELNDNELNDNELNDNELNATNVLVEYFDTVLTPPRQQAERFVLSPDRIAIFNHAG